MPAVVSHVLFADKMLPKLRKRGIDLCEEAFFYGTHGPDFLLFHRAAPWQFGKSLRKLGSLLHKIDPDRTFCAMRDYLNTRQQVEERIVLSYILGYFCHYALDRTAHPYVYAVQDVIIKEENVRYLPSIVHNRIESAIDTIMLREVLGKIPPRYNPAKSLAKNEEVLCEISKLMKFVAGRTSPGGASFKQINTAFRDMRKNIGYLHDRFLIKRPFLRLLERIFHTGPAISSSIRPLAEDRKWDYANAAKAAWRSPWQSHTERNDSFFELFELAQNDALAMIDGFLHLRTGGDFSGVTGKLGFSTGAPVVDPA